MEENRGLPCRKHQKAASGSFLKGRVLAHANQWAALTKDAAGRLRQGRIRGSRRAAGADGPWLPRGPRRAGHWSNTTRQAPSTCSQGMTAVFSIVRRRETRKQPRRIAPPRLWALSDGWPAGAFFSPAVPAGRRPPAAPACGGTYPGPPRPAAPPASRRPPACWRSQRILRGTRSPAPSPAAGP